jgi:hypothetical protein
MHLAREQRIQTLYQATERMNIRLIARVVFELRRRQELRITLNESGGIV